MERTLTVFGDMQHQAEFGGTSLERPLPVAHDVLGAGQE